MTRPLAYPLAILASLALWAVVLTPAWGGERQCWQTTMDGRPANVCIASSGPVDTVEIVILRQPVAFGWVAIETPSQPPRTPTPGRLAVYECMAVNGWFQCQTPTPYRADEHRCTPTPTCGCAP